MNPITRDDILSLADYERVRLRLRPLFMADKDRRRLNLGENLALLFENDRTVWYQIHEMIRTEHITEPAAIQHEIDTYNELVPSRGELSATLLIQFADPAERDRRLRELVGLERHLWIEFDSRRSPARFDSRQMSDDRVSAVQFVRLLLPGVDAARLVELARAGRLAIQVDHPALAARALIAGTLAEALAEDLGRD